MKNSEDILWVTRILLWNDERAFSHLMSKYLPQVRRYFIVQTMGNEATSDDLTQETFIKAWKGIRGFKQLASFETWLYRIAFNTYASYTRSNNKTTLSIDVAYDLTQEDEHSTTCYEEQKTVQKAVYSLNEKERQCITLFYLEEMSIKEIQKITGYPTGSIKVYLSRGRNNLEKILKQYERER